MELSSFKDKLFEKVHDSIKRRGMDVVVTFEEVEDWLKDSGTTEFKNNKEFAEAINARFGTTLKWVQKEELDEMEKRGIIERKGRGKILVKVSSDAPKVSVDDVKDINTSATKIKDLGKGKAKKLRVPQGKSSSKFRDFLDTILLNMMSDTKSRLLITGDPGSGKTMTTVNILSLLRLQVITIEAPHVSEEDIISIPYLVKRGATETKEESQFQQTESGYEVVHAESALITRLKNKKKITDAEYNAFLQKNKILKPLAEEYSDIIEEISNSYNTVLFLDEFYRTSGNIRVQNLLRTILNGKLGTTPIPKNVYIIYASNMDNSDGSLDDIPLNHQFNKVDFDTPNKNDFLRYMADKFSDVDVNTGEEDPEKEKVIENPLKPEVFNKFEEALGDNELGVKDPETGIRISPRRWEEIIKYVNVNLPVSNEKDAKKLLSFLRDNFKDYRTEEISSLYPKYEKLVKDLIQETSGIDASDVQPLRKSEWRDELASQIETKMKLGEARRYIPILSGPPGVGKTVSIDIVAKEYGLKKIIIDASTLNFDDSMGMAIPDGDKENLTTIFSEPVLYEQIMSEYEPDREPMSPEYKYTHVLFIDELSRTGSKVFNAIRSLLLEKKVGEKKLPEDIMIIAAMNPKDVGAEELTDHMVDTVDVIDVEANFDDVMKYIKGKNALKDVNSKIHFDLTQISIDILELCVEAFESDTNMDGNTIYDQNTKKFYWTDGFNVFYISAREFDAIVSGCVIDSYNYLRIRGKYKDGMTLDDNQIELFTQYVKDTMVKVYREALGFIMIDKAEIEKRDFEKVMIGIEDIVSSNIYRVKDGFSSIKSEALVTIKSIFDGVNYDIEQLLEYDGIDTILEKAVKDSDLNDLVNDFADIIDTLLNFDDIKGSLNKVVRIWDLLSLIDWDQFNRETTAMISEMFVNRFYNPLIQAALDDESVLEKMREWDEEITGTEIDKSFEILSNRAETNVHNMFVKV